VKKVTLARGVAVSSDFFHKSTKCHAKNPSFFNEVRVKSGNSPFGGPEKTPLELTGGTFSYPISDGL